MNKSLLFSALLCSTQVAFAATDWEEYFVDTTSGDFFDRSTIVRKGDTVQVWSMSNFVSTQMLSDGKPFNSAKVLNWIDCARQVTKTMYTVDYEGAMGSGSVVNSLKLAGTERPVVPGTVHQVLVKLACKVGKLKKRGG